MIVQPAQGPKWVKNGPDALEMGFLFYSRKQTWLNCTAHFNAEAAFTRGPQGRPPSNPY